MITFWSHVMKLWLVSIVVAGILCVVVVKAEGTTVGRLSAIAAAPLVWPAIFMLGDEADERYGIAHSAVVAWFVSIPWSAVCALAIVGRRRAGMPRRRGAAT